MDSVGNNSETVDSYQIVDRPPKARNGLRSFPPYGRIVNRTPQGSGPLLQFGSVLYRASKPGDVRRRIRPIYAERLGCQYREQQPTNAQEACFLLVLYGPSIQIRTNVR